jgi:hypothetical protein
MPPTAVSGQSLVIRPTLATWAIDSSNYIEYGNPITISVTLQSWAYFGTVNYTITGTGVTEQSLGRALTGKLTFVSTTGPDTETITWTIPSNSSITEFTLTLTSVDGSRSTDQETENDPALYYDFEENGMPIGQFITVTNNGMSNSEHSHVHLVAGDPSIVDIYLGDDDQYIKIEKDGGDVVIGTDSNNNHWIFDTDGNLTLPVSGDILDSNGTSVLDVNNPADNRVLTSDGTNTGINAESNLTFDGYRLAIDCTCPSGLAGLTIIGDQRSNLISSVIYSDPQEIATEDGTITTRQISRLIFSGARGTRVAPSGLQDGDTIFNIRGDAYNPFGTLNSLGNLENRTIRIRGLVTDTGTHYSPSTLNIETSSGGPSGLYDNSMTFDHNGILKVNNMPINIVVIDNGSVSGSVSTDASTGQIFDMIVTGSTTLSNPINAINGTTIRWRIQQDGTGGHSVSLGDQFVIPSSASSPLPWSTDPNAMDVLAATYHAGRAKWDIVAFVPGY